MNRRDWLTRVFGAVVAATVAPLVDLTDTTPAFWNQPALKGLMPWRISFPDGTVWNFDAVVVAEKLLDNGGVEFSIQPSGPMTQSLEAPAPVSEISDEEPTTASGVILTNGQGVTAELQEINLPDIENYEMDDEVVFGIARRGTLKMVVKPF